MIGSHNTFTYLKPQLGFFKLFSHYWKCQELDIKQQYDLGVRYFDIRVVRKGDRWCICHGIVTLEQEFPSLVRICTYMTLNFPKAYFRIVLEQWDDYSAYIFMDEIQYIKDFEYLDRIIIKRPWIELYTRQNACNIKEYSFEEWTWKNILKCIFKNMIKHKKKISREDALKDKNTVHFMDYV